MKYQVNGSSQNGTFELKKSANNQWLTTSFECTLKKGSNKLELLNVNGIGCWIDQITYCPADIPEEEYDIFIHQQEHGTVTASVNKAAEFAEVTLTTTVDEGWHLKGWRVIHGDVTLEVAPEAKFIMPDDIVVIEPVFQDNNVVYELDYYDELGGAIPLGWRVDQGEATPRQAPNTYGSGSRIMRGFTGYQGKALYWLEKSCEYGRLSDYPLHFEPGDYTLEFAMAAWKSTPYYKAAILTPSGNPLASLASVAATPNANGSTSANVSSAKVNKLDFTIKTNNNYVLSFTNLDRVGGYDEFLLLSCKIKRKAPANGIQEIADQVEDEEIYTLDGVKQNVLHSGVNLMKSNQGVKKVIVR